jgi:CRISPR-associated protein Cmr5
MQQPETQTMQGHPVTRRQNMEQKRGKQAWNDIEFIKKESQGRGSDTLQKEYRSRASGLNAMIQMNGLGQALGFLKAKSKDKDDKGKPMPPNAYFYLLSHLTQWMRSISFDPGIPDRHDGLLKWVTDIATSASYRRATTECLAFGTWLRRFAEAELKAPGTPEPSEAPPQGGEQ